MNIQFETLDDIETIREININAFKTSAEADLVDALRLSGTRILSLVAHERGRLFGHIVFSPVTLAPETQIRIAGLGPMAVLPEYHKRGIGSMLVSQGLNFCRAEGFSAVVVLGHPGFYPRFGFQPASKFGIRSVFDVPDDVFMAMELTPNVLEGVTGVVHYHQVFLNS